MFPQPWFGGPNTARRLDDRWETGFGYIAEQGIAPILVGEFGGRKVDTDSVEGAGSASSSTSSAARGVSLDLLGAGTRTRATPAAS